METTKLIYTKNYLLLIDEEAEINNYIIAKDLSGIAKIKEYKRTHILAIEVLQDVELGISYHQKPDWVKIIAYRKLNEKAKELDLPLLPPFQVDIEKLACEKYNIKEGINDYDERYYNSHNVAKAEAFIEGYKAAQSKGQFTLEDMEAAFEAGESACIHRVVQQRTNYMTFDKFIQSLSNQHMPSEFIPEYDEIIVDKLVPKMPIDTIKTITNSEGKEEVVGTYKY